MNCPEPQTLLRLMDVGAPDDPTSALRAHVAECASCRQALVELRGVSDLLGEWRVDAAGHDLRDRVLAAVADGGPRAAKNLPFPMLRSHGLRIAASIFLALGLGIAAGSLLPVGSRGESAGAGTLVNADTVAATLGLNNLGTARATGLASPMTASANPRTQEVLE